VITVACVWVKGHVPFTPNYVTKLQGMVSRHTSESVRFVCLTDRAYLLPKSVEKIAIALPRGLKGWWSKVELFNPSHGLTGRVLYLDLDTILVGDLDPIIHYPAPMALAPHAGTFNGKDGLQVVKRFNSSVMVWDAGTQDTSTATGFRTSLSGCGAIRTGLGSSARSLRRCRRRGSRGCRN
jgi:hypothetical protein